MNTTSLGLTVVVVEAHSLYSLRGLLESVLFAYYGDKKHKFMFRELSAIHCERYPNNYFLYALYSQAELDELYRKVDMTHRVEPIDWLMYNKEDMPWRTFSISDAETMARLEEFELFPFPCLPTLKYNKEREVSLKLAYQHVIGDVLGKTEQEELIKNCIVVFPDEESMLGSLDLLLVPLKVPKSQIRVGVMRDGTWALAVTGTIDVVKRLMDVRDDDDLICNEHTPQITAEELGFRETENLHVARILEGVERRLSY